MSDKETLSAFDKKEWGLFTEPDDSRLVGSKDSLKKDSYRCFMGGGLA